MKKSLVGSRTGWKPAKALKDEEGFDDVDAFWASSDESQGPDGDDEDVGFAAVDLRDDSSLDEGTKSEEERITAIVRSKGRKPPRAAPAPPKKASPVRKDTPPTVERPLVLLDELTDDSVEDVDAAGDHPLPKRELVPRRRESAQGLRRSKRRRWKPLAHWRNERILYTRAPSKISRDDDDDDENDSEREFVDDDARAVVYKLTGEEIVEDVQLHEVDSPTESGAEEDDVFVPNEYATAKLSNPLDASFDQDPELPDSENEEEAKHYNPFLVAPRDVVLDSVAAVDDEGVRAGVAFAKTRMMSGLVVIEPQQSKSLENTGNFPQMFIVRRSVPRSVGIEIGGAKFLVGPGDQFYCPQNTEFVVHNFATERMAEIVWILLADAKSTANAAA